jgi:hypothetical protein
LSRAVRPLFQGSDYGSKIVGSVGKRIAYTRVPGEGVTTSSSWQPLHGEDAVRDLATGVNVMHVKEDIGSDSQDDLMQNRKDRVSFGTNMTTEDESSGKDSCQQVVDKLATAVDRFHARKFGVWKGESLEKRHVLKVVNPDKAKKRKLLSSLLYRVL